MRFKLQVIVPIILALGGLVDLIARISLLPWPIGLTESLHDPGKVFFHIVLLPLISFLFIRHFPNEILQLIRGVDWRAWTARVTLIAICMLSIIQVTEDAKKGFFERLTTPENIADDTRRADFLAARLSILKEVRNGTLKPRDGKLQGREAAAKAVSGITPTFVNVLRSGSFRQSVATLLAFIGTLIAAGVFASIILVKLIGGGTLNEKGKALFLTLIALLSAWIPLKVYSEYHHNFGYFSGDDPAIIPSVIFSIIALALVFAFRSGQLAVTIPSAAVTAISSLFFIISQGMPDAFGGLSRLASEMSVMQLVFIYGGILVTLPYFFIHVNQLLEQKPAEQVSGGNGGERR